MGYILYFLQAFNILPIIQTAFVALGVIVILAIILRRS